MLFFDCLLLCLLLYFGVGNSHVPTFPLVDCTNTTIYDDNSASGQIYSRNRNNLLSILASNASQPDGFYNFTVGSVDPANDTAVYGLFLCRGDVTTSACQECVTTASNEILQVCPNRKIAAIWYNDCMLRYSNQSIFSRLDTSGGFKTSNRNYVSNPALLDKVLGETMDQIGTNAANDNSGKKFAVKEANFTTFQRIYALGQCTPDLSSLDCGTCLRTAISYLPQCCANRQGGIVLVPSCNIRYETYPFYISQISTRPPQPTPQGKLPRVAIAIALSVVSSFVLLIISFVLLKRRSMKRHDAKIQDAVGKDGDDITIDPESLRYNLSVIELATNKFSEDNKIGKGGFGAVYKGKLPSGQIIAVKRLSRSSGQGAEEFKNEIGVVAKLQHKNLVRLLGFCLEGEEKILVYEFVPNRSLDYFLFDPEKQGLLNWPRRRNIIAGIARGLLYLHEDSRLKIVHRDLKAGNILLDETLHPKIADFGMAKICRIDQSEGNTTRIAGTVGYMAPEYTRSGQYSVKSDVFSFGVVILEIITGKKNSTFYQSEDSEDLLSYAWRHWRDGTPLALLDPTIGDSYVKNEVIQNLHVGLLCVEEDADRRPNMASVMNMLNSTSVSRPTPFRPAIRRCGISECMLTDMGSDHANDKLVPESINEASITEPYPR